MLIFGIGIVVIVCGLEAVSTMGGKYRKNGHFAREDSGLAFEPNHLPGKHAIGIAPMSGFPVSVATFNEASQPRSGPRSPSAIGIRPSQRKAQGRPPCSAETGSHPAGPFHAPANRSGEEGVAAPGPVPEASNQLFGKRMRIG